MVSAPYYSKRLAPGKAKRQVKHLVRFWGAILLVGFAIAFAGPWVDPETAGVPALKLRRRFPSSGAPTV
jgi:hypothetical protein